MQIILKQQLLSLGTPEDDYQTSYLSIPSSTAQTL